MPAQFQIRDASSETSTTTVNSLALSAANFDARETLRVALGTAINNLSIGVLSKQTVTDIRDESAVIPSNPYAQREMKWLVTYQGSVSGKKFQMEIAAPNLTDNLQPNSDEADLTSTDWAAFITAFEAYAIAPDTTSEAVTVLSARLVGRNI